MTNFNEFLANGATESRSEGIEIGGSFNCQTCQLDSDEALYLMAEKILKWKCPEGHVSFIKDFSL